MRKEIRLRPGSNSFIDVLEELFVVESPNRESISRVTAPIPAQLKDKVENAQFAKVLAISNKYI